AIETQPRDQLVEPGTNAVFNVVATGETPIYYQWRFNGANISQATGAALTITNVQASHVGAYDVVVSNSMGVLASTTATLALKQDVSGLGIDGYLAGAMVFFDADFDGVKDAGEPSAQTDERGQFDLTINLSLFDTNENGRLDPEEGRLVLTGGYAIATGLPHTTVLLAPAGSTVVTPLTTLLQTILEQDQGTGVAAAEEKLKTALSITNELSVTTFDPLSGALTNAAGAVELLLAGAQVQDTMVQVAALIAVPTNSPPGSNSPAQTVMDVLGSMVLAHASLDLTSSTGVLQVIAGAVAAAGGVLPPEVAQGAAVVISGLNEIKDNMEENAADGTEVARLLTQAQSVAQGLVRESLEDVAQGKTGVDDVLVGYTGQNLTNTIVQAAVGDLSGTGTQPGRFSFTRETSRAKEDRTYVPGSELTISRYDGSKGAVRVRVSFADGSALYDDGDYLVSSIEVNFADGEISKTVPLSGVIQDDW
ncbi:hypothetical protein EG834_10230, partial [bacterium]|nr:hypothetical protein [bacterium]